MKPADVARALPRAFKNRRTVRRFFVALIGGTVILIGIALLVLPGPGVLTMLGGLAILATEFLWARRALRRCQDVAARERQRFARWWPFRRATPRADSTKFPARPE
ncbi:MAG: PGPGW domain-containing protein [Limisphaerales bacterium]